MYNINSLMHTLVGLMTIMLAGLAGCECNTHQNKEEIVEYIYMR
jgi:hypothetical protein